MGQPDDATATLAHWVEERQQLRQSENMRANLTNIVLAITTAATALLVQKGLDSRTAPLCVVILVVGLIDAVACAKYYERVQFHVSKARALVEVLVRLGALPTDTREIDRRALAHQAQFPRLHKLRAHYLWIGLGVLVASYGGVLLTVALV